jgi:RES domain-containing protein
MTGEGARGAGGRWNSPGRALIYAAETFAGSMLEVLIHMSRLKMPRNRVYVEISIENSLVLSVTSNDVPGWDAADQIASRAFGDAWLDESRSLALLVPNLATRGVERNLLINPNHRRFSEALVSDTVEVAWDARLFGSSRNLHPAKPDSTDIELGNQR